MFRVKLVAVAGHEGLEGGDAVVSLQHRAQLRLQAGDGGRHHGHRHRQTAEPAPPVAACTQNYCKYKQRLSQADGDYLFLFQRISSFPREASRIGYATPLMALTREGEGIQEAEFSWIWSQQHTEDMNETDC